MSRRLLSALLLIAVTVIVLLLNTGGHVAVSLKFFDLSGARAVVFFLFTAIGVAIGLLLK